MADKKLKKKVWNKFSEYIRLKECLETTGTIEWGACVTCGKVLPYNKLQAGHFIDGRGNSVLFVEDLVHIQCYRCNCVLKGNKDSYTPYMKNRYGEEKVDMMFLLKNIKSSLSNFELDILYIDLCEKIKKLREE